MLTVETKIILLLCYHKSNEIQWDVEYQGQEVVLDTVITIKLTHATSVTHNLEQICWHRLAVTI